MKIGTKVMTEYGDGVVLCKNVEGYYGVKIKDYDGHNCSEVRITEGSKENFNNDGFWLKEYELTQLNQKNIYLDKLDEIKEAINTLGRHGINLDVDIVVSINGKEIKL